MPTTRGWGVIAGSVVTGVAGLTLGYRIFYIFTVVGIFLVGCAVAWTSVPTRLRLTRTVAPSRVVRGGAAHGVLSLRGLRRYRRALLIYDSVAGARIDVSSSRFSKGDTDITYAIPTGRRGEIPVGPLYNVRRDALGLASRVREHGEQEFLTVLPRTVALSTVPSGRFSNLEGPTTDRVPTGTVAFHSLRDYSVGDDLRLMHWPSTARTGRLVVRQLADASLPRTTILVDNRLHAYPCEEDLELAVEVAASIAMAASRSRFPVRIIDSTGLVVDTQGGPRDAQVVIEALTIMPSAATAAPLRSSPLLGGTAGHRGALVVVNAGTEVTEARAHRRRFDRVIWIRICPEASVPAVSGLLAIDLHRLDDLIGAWRKMTAR
ncbi:DUF58 domain-containing protein [Actinomadura macrotermitis]|uniref:DUF58 domain-containing protein n=1 Tax=Actinomadura macrotermitis TaxID=2585200 RepID=A0A7K0C733_9ACTN|nr:DUF58 domain-containing protein [Actinomadura macrotermitis]MQY09245.1 hypothetical protein [Actinomadura macrotermitis]